MNMLQKTMIGAFALLQICVGQSSAARDIIQAKDGRPGDTFGYSAAIDGNTVLVGASGVDINGVSNVGAAYIYVHSETGWYLQSRLVADPYFAEDTLGGNVACLIVLPVHWCKMDRRSWEFTLPVAAAGMDRELAGQQGPN